VSDRDYAKFLREDGWLNPRLLPRAVYVEMVGRHRAKPEVIEAVYDELFWLWDLNEATRKAEEEGRQVSRAELAAELEAEMDDKDWWKLTETFEEHLIAHFADNPAEWADLIDPVYDEQERDGWIRRH
jgi:hypothetical protein